MVVPTVFAHRGYSSQAPENTLAAFRAAAAAGVDGVELDVQLTADGQLVVIHDEYLKRTTDGSGLVAEHTLAQLRALDAGAWFGSQFRGEQIPTLESVLDLLTPYPRIVVNIELKTGAIAYHGIEAKVIEAVRERGLSSRVILSSFNHYTLLTVKELAADLPVGLLYAANLVRPWEYALSLSAEALHPHHHSISPETVAAAHEAGRQVNVWTVDQESDIKRCVELGVDAIISNHPERARKVIDGEQ